MAAGEGYRVIVLTTPPYRRNVSLARIQNHRRYGQALQRTAIDGVGNGALSRPDLILTSLPPLEAPEAAVRLAQHFRCRCVVDIQDLWPESFERLVPGPAAIKKTAVGFLLRNMRRRRTRILTSADAISATTSTYLTRSSRGMTAEKPTHICPLGSDLLDVSGGLASPDALRRRANGRETADQAVLNCVYSGTLESGQDLATLVRAAERLSASGTPAVIHVAGTGALESWLREMAAKVNGTCRLHVHGLLDAGRYAALLSTCDVGLNLVKPAANVVLPNKVCDYAAAGLAIINSLSGELATLLQRFDAAVPYQAGSAISLVEAIVSLAGDRRRLTDLQANARQLANHEFNRSHTYPLWVKWLEGTANNEGW